MSAGVDVDRGRAAVLATIEELAARDASTWGPAAAPQAIDGWSLVPQALEFLHRLVARLRPRSVFEFGSGQSTAALGRACAELEPTASVVAIENDPTHAAWTRGLVADAGLDGIVEVLLAPLVARRCHDRDVPVYLLDPDAALPAPADLVLVDGPPVHLGGREGALYQALHLGRAGTIVVLDDSRRDNEREVLMRLLQRFGGHLEIANLLGFPKGLATIILVEPLPVDGYPDELARAR